MSRPMVTHVEQREQRLDEIMERMGIDLHRFRRDAHGATFEMARWNCIRCAHPTACQDWIDSLERNPMAPRPHFCPNCALLRSYMTQA